MKNSLIALFFIFTFYVTQAQNFSVTKEVKLAMDKVSPDQIRDDISYLANDSLQGRLPGTSGYATAMDYVVKRLKALGVKPAGDRGTWFQTVRLKKSYLVNQSILFHTQGKEDSLWAQPRHYKIYPNPLTKFSNLPLSNLVFVGFGISEPGLGYDDYSALDVKGKVVVLIRGAPESFSSSVKAHSMNLGRLVKVATRHGAVGILLANADSIKQSLVDLNHGTFSAIDEKGEVIASRVFSRYLPFFGNISYSTFEYLLKGSGKTITDLRRSINQGQTQSFPMDVTIESQYESKTEDIMGYNIVGKVEGSDQELKKEFVVHSAHLDHLGIRSPAILGDSIYNGAHDNASGVASLLAIAGIYNRMAYKPKRSILLVLVTGEESGLLGSSYFSHKPTVPLQNLVADINTDMPTIIAPILSITALGAEHSSLFAAVNWAAPYLNLAVEPDPEPAEARFTRSDQYSFVLAGIPALHIKYGNRTPDGKNNLNEKVALWRAKYYHKPQDDIHGIFDFEAGKKYAQLNFLIGYSVAQNPLRPYWNKGDIFEMPKP